MSKAFWLDLWERNQTPFHKYTTHSALNRYSAKLPASGRVLVPLSGKSLDMHWFQERGFEVIGIELSAIACKAYFEIHGMEYQVLSNGPFDVYSSDGIQLYCGDFFDFKTDLIFDLIYDRAALIALPPKLRRLYAKRLCDLTSPDTKKLLVTIEYQGDFEGPPYTVFEEEVHQLYGQVFDVHLLHREKNEAAPEAIKNTCFESCYLLKPS